MPDEGGAIAAAEEGIATLTEEIKALEAGAKALDKPVTEATAQRKAEHADRRDLKASNSAAKERLGWREPAQQILQSQVVWTEGGEVTLSW